MNECKYASRLDAYHDGEMAPGDSAELERHLRQCRPCATELNRLQQLSTLLSELPPWPMPAGMLNRLHASVNRLPRPGILRLAEALAALAAMIMLVCVLGLTQQAPSAGQPAAQSGRYGSIAVPDNAANGMDGQSPALDESAMQAGLPAALPPGVLVADSSEDSPVSWMAQGQTAKDDTPHD